MIKISNNHILALIAAILAITCVMSVCSPIRFERQQAGREQAVKERLVKIRYADILVREGYLADSLQYIPFAGKKKFDLTATTQISKSGRQIPLMECGAMYNDYLSGLAENSIANLIEEANNAGRYPGLKIGDITTPNDNAGNWE